MSPVEHVETENPLLRPSTLPFQLPLFSTISVEHLRSAFAEGMTEQLAEVAVAMRAWAGMNDNAQKREPITVSDVLASPMVTSPLHVLDCALVSDGAAAVVVTGADRARDLRQPPVALLGAGHGFSHGTPPIEPSRWPRSPRDGVPMRHVATLLVPAEYRAAGPEKVALAVFQADDHVRARVEGAPRHEGDALLLEDAIGGSYALVWLDAAAFARGPGGDVPEGVQPGAPQFLRLRARIGDPNVGKVIPDWDEEAGEYVAPDSDEGEAMKLSRFSFPNSRILAHFGGTSFACDNFARGLGPVYLALEHRFGGANFGGGNAVIDLARRRVRFGS